MRNCADRMQSGNTTQRIVPGEIKTEIYTDIGQKIGLCKNL